jgi:hypothetical protein
VCCSICLDSGIDYIVCIVVGVGVGYLFGGMVFAHVCGFIVCSVWYGEVGGPAPCLLKNILVCQLPPARWYLHLF